MKFLPLIWSSLVRKKVRTLFTLLSIFIAFLLFGYLSAIIADPTLLLCDEPTGDLDRKAGDEVLDLLDALNTEQGKTIIMVTHDPHAARRAKRILYLDKGALSTEPAE